MYNKAVGNYISQTSITHYDPYMIQLLNIWNYACEYCDKKLFAEFTCLTYGSVNFPWPNFIDN